MPIDTSIHNIGEYYSAHYLDSTFDSDIKELRREWGIQGSQASPRRLQGLGAKYFRAKNEALEIEEVRKRYAARSDNSDLGDWHSQLLQSLGYSNLTPTLWGVDGGRVSIPVLGRVDRLNDPWLAIVETAFALPAAAIREGLPEEVPLELEVFPEQLPADVRRPDRDWGQAIGRLFRVENSPRWVMFLAGSQIMLFDRHTFSQGRYLAFDLDDAYARREKSSFDCIAAFLSRETLCPGVDTTELLHDKLEEQSHKFAHGVSEKLQFAVREAIELIAREWVEERRRLGLSYTSLRLHEALPDGSREVTAEQLRHEALIYVYRMLFCLYAEAHGGDLGILPISDEHYRLGYSIEALRDLELVPLSAGSEEGYYFHEHLKRLFQIIHEGFQPDSSAAPLFALPSGALAKTFVVRPLTATLFDPDTTPLLARARLNNRSLQQVIRRLSLGEDPRGRRKVRVNYAELGINQLGAVYEGLLSYKGMFADQDLIQVKAAGREITDVKTQSWFVSKERLADFAQDEVVRLTEGKPRIYPKGTFILHLSGIDREQSASYYTPEVLTKSLVEEALRELLKDYTPADADRILELKVCEPAMGSGAFLNEAAYQLAHKYLELKQKQVRETIDPARYGDEHRRVKHYLASRNFYGVDLNPTAVELGSLSLWLGCMHRLLIADGEGKRPDVYQVGATPWFGLRLCAGNSLIGARRAVWTAEQLQRGFFSGNNSETPRLLKPGERRKANEIYHFLVFDEGMVSASSEREIRRFLPGESEKAREWLTRQVKAKWNRLEIEEALELSSLIDTHWGQYEESRLAALRATACTASVWPLASNDEQALKPGPALADQETTRRMLEASSGSFQRLKLIMDTWCALWMWPVDEHAALPSREVWLIALQLLLGRPDQIRRRRESLRERLGLDVDALLAATQNDVPDVEAVSNLLPTFSTSRRLSSEQLFFHWELQFSDILGPGGLGGFDLVLGNPPWIKTSWEEATVLAELDPLVGVRELKSGKVNALRSALLTQPESKAVYSRALTAKQGQVSYLSSSRLYGELAGAQSNLYKNFIVQVWRLLSPRGLGGLLHPEGVFDETRAPTLRREYYPRLRAHYQFNNELSLFRDVDHHNAYSINIFSGVPGAVCFRNIVNLFHPQTLKQCFSGPASAVTPGIRNEEGTWELRGHPNRVVTVGDSELRLFARLYSVENDWQSTPIPQVHSIELVSVLQKISARKTIGELHPEIVVSDIFHESGSQQSGEISRQDNPTFQPEVAGEVILTGPLFYVGNPFYKTCRTSCTKNSDYDELDLTELPEDFLPRTVYKPGDAQGNKENFVRTINGVGLQTSLQWRLIDCYRFGFRLMCSSSTERTLIGSIVSPGAASIHGVLFLAIPDVKVLLEHTTVFCSVLGDFVIKAKGRANVYENDLLSMPAVTDIWRAPLVARMLRLSCLTRVYEKLWTDVAASVAVRSESFSHSTPLLTNEFEESWNALDLSSWTWESPLRTDYARRLALIEIDTLVALSVGLTLEELIAIYTVQFPVLRGYEQVDEYDAKGRRLPSTARKTPGARELREARRTHDGHTPLTVSWKINNGLDTVTRTYYPPFVRVDRDEDYARAYEFFKKRCC